MQVKEDAVRIGDTRGLVLCFVLQIYGDAGVDRSRPVANASHQRQPALTRRGRRSIHGCFTQLWSFERFLRVSRFHERGRLLPGSFNGLSSRSRVCFSRFCRRCGWLWPWCAFCLGDGMLSAPFCNFLFADVAQFLAGLVGERAFGIELQKLLKGLSGTVAIIQIVKVDFAFCQQGAVAKTAARILSAQKFILPNGVMQGLFILEEAALFSQKTGDGRNAGVGLWRCRVSVI